MLAGVLASLFSAIGLIYLAKVVLMVLVARFFESALRMQCETPLE